MQAPDEPTPDATQPPPPPPAPSSWPVAGPPSGPRTGPDLPPPAAEEVTPDLDDRSRALDPRIVTVWRIGAAIGLAIPATVVSALALFLLGRNGAVIAAVVLLLVVVTVVWYPTARYERWHWRLDDLAIELERGILVRRTESVPYFRIQQIDVNQGPVDRMLGLASLQVTSASASGSVTLPGIAADQAPGVRRALLARAAAAVAAGPDTGVRDAV